MSWIEMSGSIPQNRRWHALKGGLGLMCVALAMILLTSCGTSHAVIARLRSREAFIPTAADPNVRYMPGSKALADRLARAIGRSIAIVEQTHQATFKSAPKIFVCASACFTRYSLSGDETPAAQFGDSVFMNQDRLVEREQRHGMPPENFLTHELSHLLLYQYVGAVAADRIPVWFKEGLAVSVSNGDATVTATRSEATQALLAGHAFDPAEHGDILGGRSASSYGLPISLFYREAEMFVVYLQEQDPTAFKAALGNLLKRGNFQDCFARAYGRPIAAYWPGFIRSLHHSTGA